jgi:uncharacterized RmlC-like cupin family protein
MAKAGDELLNSVTGLRTVFRKTAEETSGELLQVDWIGEPGWTTGPDHVHPRQEERFEVLSGRLGLRVGGVERVHSAGDVVVAPAGAPHAAWNAGDSSSRKPAGGHGADRSPRRRRHSTSRRESLAPRSRDEAGGGRGGEVNRGDRSQGDGGPHLMSVSPSEIGA